MLTRAPEGKPLRCAAHPRLDHLKPTHRLRPAPEPAAPPRTRAQRPPAGMESTRRKHEGKIHAQLLNENWHRISRERETLDVRQVSTGQADGQ